MGKNHLIKEKSPYLLQHANNPVHWFSWCDNAFSKAVSEDKPIFLSIGYSTCHWCHVMEYESFQNQEVADLLNAFYISIKVDREERPDIDAIYMKSVQAMTGQGGWPLNVFLTPNKKPFFGGTYFPPFPKWGVQGFPDLLKSIAYSWEHQRAEILTSSEKIFLFLNEAKQSDDGIVQMSLDDFGVIKQKFKESFDSEYGGLSGAPKFPMGHMLSFLLALHFDNPDQELLDHVLSALKNMAKGGICDQLGGGFHRYSTDCYWQLPHFEKMLYDQALLSFVYLEAYQITNDKFYADVARSIFDYVIRDMQDEQGGFYSAEDADSVMLNGDQQKKEGVYYVWSQSMLRSNLSEEAFKILTRYYGILPSGNVKQDPHGDFAGLNVLYQAVSLEKVAHENNLSLDEVSVILTEAKKKLFELRTQRPRPSLDDKILTDWNGLMIAALSFGSRVLDEPCYAEAAKKSADFILKHMADGDDIYHRFRDQELAIMGSLTDYSFFIHGLHYLYEATFLQDYLAKALHLTQVMVDRFYDGKSGFYMTQKAQRDLLYRPFEIHDSAIPSGNGMAVRMLLKLMFFQYSEEKESMVDTYFKSYGDDFKLQPISYTVSLQAFMEWMGKKIEVVIAEGAGVNELPDALNIVYSYYTPNKRVFLRPNNDKGIAFFKNKGSFIKEQNAIDNKLTVYLCHDQQCEKPIIDLNALQQQFER